MDISTTKRTDLFQRKDSLLSNFCSIIRKAKWPCLLLLWASGFIYQATAQCTAAVTSVTGGSVGPPGGVVNLSAVGTGRLHWYDALTEGNRVNIGPTYSPTITATTHYFVESVAPTGPNATATPPAQSSTFSSNIRGYWFTSPADIIITSVYVPTDASTGNQNIAVVKFNGAIPPPLFSATTNDFTTLFLTQNNTESGPIPVEIVIHAGDVIGILGARANTTSYSTSGQSMTIAGTSVALARLGMQFPLSSTMPQDLWTESGGSIGRIQFDYTPVCFSTPRTQVTATLECTPQVSITANPSGTVTAGTTITFTATPTYAGAAPTYQWKKNGGNVGTNSPTYTDNSPVTGDKIICVITSNEECALPNNTATSNEITLCLTPIIYNITGGGTYCGGSAGVLIGLSGSQTGVNYQLKEGVNNAGSPIAGTGSTFNFPLQTTVGTYTVVAVSNGCMATADMSGSAVISTYSKPTVTLNVYEQTFSEGSTTELCDTDANPSNNALVFNAATACAVGSLVWRTQIGAGVWSSWNATAPSTQPSDNQLYRYQAACNSECSTSYTSAIDLKINYRASIPQNVSLVADGTTVNAGESKSICNTEGNSITFNATCGEGEILLYSVDGGSFSNVTPSQIVDGNFHNYRVRCRKADGTPSCAETESGVMTFKIQAAPTVYNVTGGGFYCEAGVVIGLEDSETGVSYQLKNGDAAVGLPVEGTGDAISFPPQTVAGNYTVEAVLNECMITATMAGSAAVFIYSKPTIALSIYEYTFPESSTTLLCDTDANPSNNALVFNVATACAVGSLVWRTQIGAGAWSSWNATAPSTQPSDNQLYRYQAACDSECPASYTSAIGIQISYRASIPQNVSLVADGTTVNAGESKSICNTEGNSITFNATCGESEILLYSVDGGSFSNVTPSQIVDGNFHNYRVRCRKADNTASCVETESATMSLKISVAPTVYNVTGGGFYCGSGPGVTIGLSGSQTGVSYQLKQGVNNIGPPVAGTGLAFSFPLQTIAGTYTIVASSNECMTTFTMSGSAAISNFGKPTVTLSVHGQTFLEGNQAELCDTDANPSNNSLVFNITTACAAGSIVWRTQSGAGAWSDWSATTPSAQPSSNIAYKYQAACDPACPSTLSGIITLTINYRASTPQNVSLVADGTTVNAGESKTICNIEGNTLTFNATCGTGEILLYSVDGGNFSNLIPSQIVDGNFHNYRLRCRKADNTPSCIEAESGVMSLKITTSGPAPTISISPLSGCGIPVAFSGSSTCGVLTTIWFNAATNQALPTLPTTTPNATASFYARCQNEAGCQSEKSNTVTFTITPVNDPPTISASADIVCTGTLVTVSTTCPAGSSVFWNTGVTENSFQVAFSNVTQQSYWAKCIYPNGCQSPESIHKTILWKAFDLTFINIGQSQSAIKPANDRALWTPQFIMPDAGPVLENSTEANPTIYHSENVNKTAPRYWTIQVETCALGTDGSVTYDLLASPEAGVPQSFNTHENNAPYLMYANREGFTELYAQNHPAYGFYQDNGSGGNTYDAGLPKGLYKLSVRYWDQKGQGSIYPSTRQPAGNVLAYQEYWFRIQSKNGIGTGSTRVAATADNGQRRTENGAFAQVAPNPVTNTLRLNVAQAKDKKVNISLVDASGRTLLQRAFVPQTNQHQEELEVSDLANGMYFLRVNTAEKHATLKVVKVQ